jgi:hypothetical protein
MSLLDNLQAEVSNALTHTTRTITGVQAFRALPLSPETNAVLDAAFANLQKRQGLLQSMIAQLAALSAAEQPTVNVSSSVFAELKSKVDILVDALGVFSASTATSGEAVAGAITFTK